MSKDPDYSVQYGDFQQLGSAFGHVLRSFCFVSDHMDELTEFRSVIRRLHEFERAAGIAREPVSEKDKKTLV